MPKISVCIPTYEMKGKGAEFLNFSFDRLNNQTFKDFDVVISDHSLNNEIKSVCESWNNKLNIKYYANENGRGISSVNINNAIKHAEGEAIKILFQDDFLLDSSSLELQYVHFFSNYNAWMVTACAHTSDGKTINNPFYPRYHDNIQYGENTISSPSVLMIKNEDKLYFDENLFWLMDVEYYKRLYDQFGLPSICNYITVVNRSHENQVSNALVTKEVRDRENRYVIEKYRNK